MQVCDEIRSKQTCICMEADKKNPPSAHKTEKFWVLGEKLLLLPGRVGASGLKTGGPEPGAQSQRDIPGCPGSGHEKTPLVSQRGFVI
jgi:hypothetical protein